jgi:SAM-dependent methyltransferase
MSAYALTGHQAEADRLRFLSSAVADLTWQVLDRVPLPAAARILDAGSGSGRLVADLAGQDPAREVVGVDVDTTLLAAAREYAAERGVTNAAFEHASVTDLPFPDASFDLVTCRFVLMHVPDPLAALAEMRRVCRPGGAVVVIESDWGGQLLSPSTPVIERFRELGAQIARQVGINPHQGRELFGLMCATGLTGVEVTAHADVSTAADSTVVAEKLRTRLAMLRHIAPRLGDLAPVDEVAAISTEVEALLAAPDLFATEFRVAATGLVPAERPAAAGERRDRSLA